MASATRWDFSFHLAKLVGAEADGEKAKAEENGAAAAEPVGPDR